MTALRGVVRFGRERPALKLYNGQSEIRAFLDLLKPTGEPVCGQANNREIELL